MRVVVTFAVLLALTVIATPIAAKPKDNPGHGGGHRHDTSISESEAEDAPGASGWAQWCRQDDFQGFRNHGQCVSAKVHEHIAGAEASEARNGNENDNGDNGD